MAIMLLLHILIAIGSLILTSVTSILPSKMKLNMSYISVALTLLSGTYLVISTKSHILQACTTGLIYLSIASFGIVVAKKRLANN